MEMVHLQQRRNRRHFPERFIKGRHLGIKALKERNAMGNNYLAKIIPPYPKPKFPISEVFHLTGKKGLDGILEGQGAGTSGFRGIHSDLLWMSPHVTDEDVREAENRLIVDLFPEKDEQRQRPFLKEFMTSPVFLESSLYGNFRFTFSLKDFLQMYKEQFCDGREPIFRVHETVLYKQEIMHSVIVHSPKQTEFDDYPLLEDNDDAICVYNKGELIWYPEAICETHTKEMVQTETTVEINTMPTHEFFVWDHVALAFYLPSEKNEKGLLVEKAKLVKCLTACEVGHINLNGKDDPSITFIEAQEIVNGLQGPNAPSF